MTMYANGTASPELEDETFSSPETYTNPEFEDEGAHFSSPEWETHYSNPESHYSNPETHYSNPESHYSSPESHYSNPESHYSNPELESHYSNPELYSSPEAHEWEATEWEDEAHEWEATELEDESSPYSNPERESHYSNPERESHYSNPYSTYSNPYSNPETEDEADAFLPLLAPLAMKALPLIGKAVLPMARKLIPFGKRAISGVVRNVLGGAGGPGGAPMRPGVRRAAGRPSPGGVPVAGRPAGVPGGIMAAVSPRQRATVAGLFRQLGALFGEAETETSEVEAQLFGANEFEGELAAHESAHEAALTEVLAAEAAHTQSESEAEALLGAALPITIRIMGGGSSLRRVAPTLARANARLVRSIRNSSPAGPQLLRTVPAIQRRTIATLRAAQRAGNPVTPRLAARAMAGQAARVLGTPHICGRSLVRNAAIRRATVAPAGVVVRTPRRVRAAV